MYLTTSHQTKETFPIEHFVVQGLQNPKEKQRPCLHGQRESRILHMAATFKFFQMLKSAL